MNRKLLGIYLNDHLAGSTVGLELVKRAVGSNKEGELGDFLATLAQEIDADRESLRAIMKRLEYGEDIPKKLTAWTAEKLGRLKPNGQLTGYSPLSRIVELEGLTVGVRGKLSLWENLRATFGEEVADRNLDGLIARANGQLEGLTEHRTEAARVAFEDEITRVA